MADQMTTPDPTLAARLDAMLEPALQYDSVQDELHGALDTALRSGQLITLADHTAAVQAAVAKAVEACAAWHDHEAVGAMNSLHCGSENSEYRAANRLCDFHRTAASAIRARKGDAL